MEKEPAEVSVVAHPPERGRRSITLSMCGGCCCCCCCLHTIGGVVGAALGSRQPRPEAATTESSGFGSAAGIYWLILIFLCAVVPGPLVAQSEGYGSNFVGWLEVTGFIVLIGLPAIQLVAAILAAIMIKLAPASLFPEKSEPFHAIARIAFFSLGLTAAGFAVMVLLYVVWGIFS